MPKTKREVMWLVAMLDLVNARLSIIEEELDKDKGDIND